MEQLGTRPGRIPRLGRYLRAPRAASSFGSLVKPRPTTAAGQHGTGKEVAAGLFMKALRAMQRGGAMRPGTDVTKCADERGGRDGGAEPNRIARNTARRGWPVREGTGVSTPTRTDYVKACADAGCGGWSRTCCAGSHWTKAPCADLRRCRVYPACGWAAWCSDSSEGMMRCRR